MQTLTVQSQMMTGRILAALIESSDDAIIAKNLDGIILSWNRGAEQMYGYSASEAIGRSNFLLDSRRPAS